MTWDLVTHESELTSIPGLDDWRCTAPAEVQEEDRLWLLLQHSTLSPYSLDTDFWRSPPLAFDHLCPSTRCPTKFIAPVGWWLQEGVLVGERELQCRVRRCGRISRCGQPYDPLPMDLNDPDHCSWGGCRSAPWVSFAWHTSWYVRSTI
jgi:hypothetical protein